MKKVIVQDGVIAGHYYNKHESRNWIAQNLVSRFHRTVKQFADQAQVRTIHEVGCGEGHVTLDLAQPGRAVRASDFSNEVIAIAQRNAERAGKSIEFSVKSIYDLAPSEDSAELIVACEVLEHLEDPKAALLKVVSLAKPWLLVSVPNEPIWRILNLCRGKYIRDLGNTPGHIQHWSSRGFRRFLVQHVEVVSWSNPLPWSVALCRVR